MGDTPPTMALLPRYGLGLHPGRKYPDMAPLWANEGGAFGWQANSLPLLTILSEVVFLMKVIFLIGSKVWQCCQTLPLAYKCSTGRSRVRPASTGDTKLQPSEEAAILRGEVSLRIWSFRRKPEAECSRLTSTM